MPLSPVLVYIFMAMDVDDLKVLVRGLIDGMRDAF